MHYYYAYLKNDCFVVAKSITRFINLEKILSAHYFFQFGACTKMAILWGKINIFKWMAEKSRKHIFKKYKSMVFKNCPKQFIFPKITRQVIYFVFSLS